MSFKAGDLVSADNYWAVIVGKYQNADDFYWVDYLSVKPEKSEMLPSYLIKGCRADYCLDREYFQQLLGWAKRKHPGLEINFIQEKP
jgi:hypothetical protein